MKIGKPTSFICNIKSELARKIQEQLDRNFQMLYLLQLSQYDRSSAAVSEKEQKIGIFSLFLNNTF
jgi:hypothetical protein